jgi:integrase
MFGRKRPKVADRDRLRIPVHQWPHMLNLAGEQSPRDRLIVALGLYTLLRDQEMAQLRIRDVDLGAGTIRAVITKSKTEDSVAISGDLDPELRTWLRAYQISVGPLLPDMLLIPRVRGARVRNESTGQYVKGRFNGDPGHGMFMPYGHIKKLSYVLTPLIEKLGYPVVDEDGNSLREGAHTLRRSAARAYYDHFTAEGRADALRIVQTMLHHKNSQQTQHYIGLREDRETRDTLVRGVTIFGLHELSTIGGTVSGDTQGRRAVM